MRAGLEIAIRGRRGNFSYHWQARVPVGDVVGIFGPSGAGKSSLLRAIAGLDKTVSGRLALGDEVWLDTSENINIPVHQRGIGYVFQEARLLPHLDVLGNIAFAARRAGANRVHVQRVCDALDIDELAATPVTQLSGGERQRVAIARALVMRPSLLLLDEPLSANDIDRRNTLLPYLRRVIEEWAVPTLFVSHSLDEMAALTDTLMICRRGRIAAFGSTADLVARDDLVEVAASDDSGVVISACVAAIDSHYGLARLAWNEQSLTVPMGGLVVGDTVRLQVHARDVAIALEEPLGVSIRNVLPARIMEIPAATTGVWVDVVLDVGGQRLKARITRASRDALLLQPDQPCFALVKSASVALNPALMMQS